MFRALFALATGLLLGLASACSPASRDDGPLVLAAASLQEALEDAADAWAKRGHPRPILSFAGTQALARQIEAGAPGDLFVSADEAWMNELARRNLIRHRSRAVLATNDLVLVAPKDSPLSLTISEGFPLREALGEGRLALADPDAVPAGRYAGQALTSLRVWQDVADRIASAENVRAALSFVARGEAPLGIVYRTDALTEPGVRIVASFPAATHVPIAYPMALLSTSSHRDGEAFEAFLLSPEGQEIMARRGFGTVADR